MPVVENQNVPQNYQSVQENYKNPGNYQSPTGNYQTEQSQYGNNQNEPVYYQNQPTNQSEPANYQNQPTNTQSQPTNYQNQPNNQFQPTPDEKQPQNNQDPQVNYQNQPSNNQPVNYQKQPEDYQTPTSKAEEIKPEVKPSEEKLEPSTLDLLSDIDFSVELKPLTPEIKVPQISENAIKKPAYQTRMDVPKAQPKVEEVIERPAKKDLFSDPSLLNKFTEEVKGLQKLVDKLSSKTATGVTLLDSKWKTYQDVQVRDAVCLSFKCVICSFYGAASARIFLQSF